MHEQVLEQVALWIEELEAANDGSIDIVKVLERLEPEYLLRRRQKNYPTCMGQTKYKVGFRYKNYLNELMEQKYM